MAENTDEASSADEKKKRDIEREIANSFADQKLLEKYVTQTEKTNVGSVSISNKPKEPYHMSIHPITDIKYEGKLPDIYNLPSGRKRSFSLWFYDFVMELLGKYPHERKNRAALLILIPLVLSVMLMGKNFLSSNPTGYAISSVPLQPADYVLITALTLGAAAIVLTYDKVRKSLYGSLFVDDRQKIEPFNTNIIPMMLIPIVFMALMLGMFSKSSLTANAISGVPIEATDYVLLTLISLLVVVVVFSFDRIRRFVPKI